MPSADSGPAPATVSRRPEYLGDPTLGRVMLRPRWILALLLALAVAAVFALLGRWQLESAIQNATKVIETETPRPLTEVAAPGAPVSEAAGGAVVEITGTFLWQDLGIVSPRLNQDETGAWVVAHLLTSEPEPSHLVVAIGWAPSEAAAAEGIAALQASDGLGQDRALGGRYMPGESTVIPQPDEDPLAMQVMVPGQVINSWGEVDSPTYAGYLVLHPEGVEDLLEIAGLDPIDSVPPEDNQAVNWLNVFYAIEWAVFAGAAVFMWVRLVRDGWEKEHELKLLAAEAAATK